MAENPAPEPRNGNQQQVVAPLPQIQDIDGWLRFNGLRSADDEAPEYGSFQSVLNRSEAHANQEAQERYQQEVHDSIFRDAREAEEQQKIIRKRYLELWKDELMQVVTADQTISVPLSPVAAACDTIFTMASSRRYMDSVTGNNKSSSSSESKENENAATVRLSLEEYPTAAVQEFLELILLQKEIQDMESQYVVDCCHIGHYLQCSRVLDGTTHILLQNVDSGNCLSICQMADQLELPDLFERALFHMLKSLDQLESQEAYEAFSSELKGRIADIRAVFTSHDQHPPSRDRRKKTALYFTSLDEYIAIFAENVQYYRERLQEAKEQNADKYSGYAQSKIEKQELRVLTLEAMLQEQKRVFGKKQQQESLQNKRMKV